MTWDAVVVPSAPALLPAYTGLVDPIAEMRSLTHEAVAWLAQRAPERIVILGAPADPANLSRGVSEPLSTRIACSLLSRAGYSGIIDDNSADLSGGGVLVVADGSARRGEKAPGYIDERSFEFDDAVDMALRTCDAAILRDLPEGLGADLLAAGVPALKALGSLADASRHVAEMTYSGDPFGVQYWVVKWNASPDPARNN